MIILTINFAKFSCYNFDKCVKFNVFFEKKQFILPPKKKNMLKSESVNVQEVIFYYLDYQRLNLLD